MLLNRSQVDTILKNAPLGTDKTKLLDGLIMRGYDIEGVDSNIIRQQLTPQPKPSFLGELKTDLDTRVDKVGAIQNRTDSSMLEKGVQTFGQGAGLAANAIEQTAMQIPGVKQGFEAFGTGINWLATSELSPIKHLGDVVGSNKALQEATALYDTDQNFKDSVDAVANVARLGGDVQMVMDAVNFTKNATNKIVNKTNQLADKTRTMLPDDSSASGLLTRAKNMAEPVKTPEQALGQISQGKVGDITPVRNALESIDTSGVNTFKDLQGRIQQSIPEFARQVDKELIKDPGIYKLKDLEVRRQTNSGKIVSTDYVTKSLTDLKELYRKIGDKVEESNITETLTKAKKTGLTRKEVNDVSRMYGQEFGSKAFSKATGEPLTSVNAQAFENTRSGLKTTAREGLGGAEAKALDGKLSDLYDTQKLIDRNVEAVNKLKQKINERGLIEKAGYLVAKYGDMLTGGSIRGFVGGILPRGAGYKVMNALDVESALRKNLDIVERAFKAKTDGEMLKILQSSDSPIKPPSTASETAPRSVKATITTNKTNKSIIPRSIAQPKPNVKGLKAPSSNFTPRSKTLLGDSLADQVGILSREKNPGYAKRVAEFNSIIKKVEKDNFNFSAREKMLIEDSVANKIGLAEGEAPRYYIKDLKELEQSLKGKGGILETIKNKGKDILDNPKMGLATEDVSSGSSKLGQRIVKEGEQKPTIKLKRDVQITTLSGEKTMIPENEVLKAYESGGKAVLKDGREYVVSKSQYENIKNNSLKNEAKEFAPELKGTEETQYPNARTYENAQAKKIREQYNAEVSNQEGRANTNYAKVDKLAAEYKKITGEEVAYQKNTKFSSYQLPGGKNYKEIIIKAPVEKSPNTKSLDQLSRENYSVPIEKLNPAEKETIMRIADKQNPAFRSSHFPDEPNPISHLRLNERTYKGKNVTFLEELQSDWASAARKDPKKDTTGWTAKRTRDGSADESFDVWEVYDKNGGKITEIVGGTKGTAKGAIEKAAGDTPNHPLLKNWQELSIKRGLQEAVANKSDYFAWINGEQTSARYNLATYLDKVNWETSKVIGKPKQIYLNGRKGENFHLNVDNNGIIKGGKSDWIGKKLDEVLGKGLADKIMSKETGTLSGEGLSFGGEWADNLYNKQTKNIVEDLTGGKVEVIDMGLPVSATENSFYDVEAFSNARNRGATQGEGKFKLTPEKLKIGKEIVGTGVPGRESYIITDILGEGKFKAVPKDVFQSSIGKGTSAERKVYLNNVIRKKAIESATETFDISTPKSSGQMAIKLTPEIKAIIRGEAPPMTKASGKSPIK